MRFYPSHTIARKNWSSGFRFSVNEERKAQIVQQVFGQRSSSPIGTLGHREEIVTAYFAQATVEHAFRSLKDDHYHPP